MSNVDRADTVIYDGEAALEDARALLDAKEERHVRRRREVEIPHVPPTRDGPLVRRREIESAAALPVNDGVPARRRGAGVASARSSWAGFSAVAGSAGFARARGFSVILGSPGSAGCARTRAKL